MDAVAQAADEAGTTRRYITISSLEVRDEVNKPVPDWYDEDDRAYSKWAWPIFRPYFQARLASDKDLVERNAQRRLDYTRDKQLRTLLEQPASEKSLLVATVRFVYLVN